MAVAVTGLDLNMGEGEKIRAEAVAAGIWPPPRPEGVQLLEQESPLAVPASARARGASGVHYDAAGAA
jgi:hypothetical protein